MCTFRLSNFLFCVNDRNVRKEIAKMHFCLNTNKLDIFEFKKTIKNEPFCILYRDGYNKQEYYEIFVEFLNTFDLEMYLRLIISNKVKMYSEYNKYILLLYALFYNKNRYKDLLKKQKMRKAFFVCLVNTTAFSYSFFDNKINKYDLYTFLFLSLADKNIYRKVYTSTYYLSILDNEELLSSHYSPSFFNDFYKRQLNTLIKKSKVNLDHYVVDNCKFLYGEYDIKYVKPSLRYILYNNGSSLVSIDDLTKRQQQAAMKKLFI